MSEKDSLPRYLVEQVYKSSAGDKVTSACNCIGPQDGQPLCPCMMRNVKVIDGRYVQIKDLGPVK